MIENYKISKGDALYSLLPDGGWGVKNDTPIYFETVAFQPTDAEINAKVVELQAKYDAQEYARKRQAEYPDWGSQLNKIYDDGVTKWKSDMVDPVKAKWPKDNSGPV